MRKKIIEKKIIKKRQFLTSLVVFAEVAFTSVFFLACSREQKTEAEPSSGVSPSLEARIPFEGKIFFQSDMDGDNEIYLLTKNGLNKITDNNWQDEFPRVSPDGKWVAFSSNRYGNYDIFVMAVDGSRLKRLTASPYDEGELSWSPDGKKIVFTEERKRTFGRSYTLWSVDLSTGERKRMLESFSGSGALPDFSRQSGLLTFTGKKTLGWDVYVVNLGKTEAVNLTKNGQTCRSRFSKDGGLLVYVSHEADGKGEIYIIQPDGQRKTRLTERPATFDYFPAWSPDGRFVVFCSNSKDMYAEKGDWDLYLVEVATKKVQLLFAGPGRDVFPEWVD
ncbi:MAG: TolB family protein [Candidatus Aminicenantales bacterium]